MVMDVGDAAGDRIPRIVDHAQVGFSGSDRRRQAHPRRSGQGRGFPRPDRPRRMAMWGVCAWLALGMRSFFDLVVVLVMAPLYQPLKAF